jgi:serine/threonine protein kinase
MALNLAAPTEIPGETGPHGTKVVKPPPPPDEIAKHFPQFEILECLGRGGMGVVYKARQPKLNRIVALKILAPEKLAEAKFAERFEREAQALARLNHSNIVTVYDFGEADGLYYLTMEFVDGVSLRQLLQTRKMAPEEALAIVPKICEALQFAHEQGVVHRDIKPENVLLDKRGRVKIADFGIAKIMGDTPFAPSDGEKLAAKPGAGTLTQDQVLGTPHYMAPEQVERPQKVDHRADIYSLGVVFYEMLTGELPLGRFAPPSRKVQVDVRLDEVVLRALEKEPERRYQQASVLKTEVETISGTSGKQPSRQERKTNMNTRNLKPLWYGLAAIACLPLALVGLAFFAWVSARDTTRVTGSSGRLTQEGWQLWQGGRPAEAIPKFESAINLDAKNSAAWNGLGWASFNSGKAAEAEKAFQKVIELEPNHPAALNGLGQICLSQKKYVEAESYLLKAGPKAPAAWYGLTKLYLIQGKFEQAEKWAQMIVDSGQADEDARAMLKAAKDKKLSDGLRLMIEPQ